MKKFQYRGTKDVGSIPSSCFLVFLFPLKYFHFPIGTELIFKNFPDFPFFHSAIVYGVNCSE